MKIFFRLAFFAVSLVSGFFLASFIDQKTPATSSHRFAVMELFTSQGCSSCPPADRILGKYAAENNPEIIALAFHVDYWNYIGWNDPFSNKEYSRRQNAYGKRLKSTVYTPQLIVNGTKQLVGSNENSIRKTVGNALTENFDAVLSLEQPAIENDFLTISYRSTFIPNAVINVALVKKKVITNIKRGENSGLKHTNYNVVVGFSTMAVTDQKMTTTIPFDSTKNASEYFVVVYIQEKDLGKILDAAKLDFR